MKLRNLVRCLVECCRLVAVVFGLAVMITLGAVPAAAAAASSPTHQFTVGTSHSSSQHRGNRAASKGTTPARMQSMQCMSEMQTMMASMGSTHHMMSMQAMMTMMASMHLPRHATHAQCIRAMQTMMMKMHPKGQTQAMRTRQPECILPTL